MFLLNPYILGSTPSGQQVFTSSGTFAVPTGVTSISAVAVGCGGIGANNARGGDLRYAVTIAVTPGESLDVLVSTTGGVTSLARSGTVLLAARGGTGGTSSTTGGNIGGGNGGSGGSGSTGNSGGGGAGGYSGDGGAGGSSNGSGSNGSGGGGGGGGAATASGGGAGGGGGVGLLGPGSNGTGGASGANGSCGTGGSNGLPSTSSQTSDGGNYGGARASASGSPRGAGALRIIWGPGRAYPSTGVADV